MKRSRLHKLIRGMIIKVLQQALEHKEFEHELEQRCLLLSSEELRILEKTVLDVIEQLRKEAV